MKTVIVASGNPVKVQATLNGFGRMFAGEEFQAKSVRVPSGVSAQPLSDEETYRGACNRARQASQAHPQADFWVGIEGGVEERQGEMLTFAWVVVHSLAGSGRGRTGTFFLPPEVAGLIRQGKELGEADDIVFARTNSKQENGAVGLLTGNVLDRTQLYEQGVLLALIPFKNTNLYFPH